MGQKSRWGCWGGEALLSAFPFLRDTGDDGGGALHDEVALAASFCTVAGVQGDAHPFLGVVRVVDSEMAPPSAMVIPEVVVWIGCASWFGGDGGGLHLPRRTQGIGHPLS